VFPSSLKEKALALHNKASPTLCRIVSYYYRTVQTKCIAAQLPADAMLPPLHAAQQQPAACHTQQVKLQQPADIEGCVSLRSEEDGFWSRMLAAKHTPPSNRYMVSYCHQTVQISSICTSTFNADTKLLPLRAVFDRSSCSSLQA
jgi:hypothetical protein